MPSLFRSAAPYVPAISAACLSVPFLMKGKTFLLHCDTIRALGSVVTYRPGKRHVTWVAPMSFFGGGGVKCPASEATDAPQPWGILCNPVMKRISFSFFQVMEHRWNEIDRGKPVLVPLCPPQIPHGLTRDRTRVSVVGGRRLTAWATARQSDGLTLQWSI
jgi:hypothetical protein